MAWRLEVFDPKAPGAQAFVEAAASKAGCFSQAFAFATTALFRPFTVQRRLVFQALIRWVVCQAQGFAFWHWLGFKPFWPLALVPIALAAIIFKSFRRFGVTVLFAVRARRQMGLPVFGV